MVLQSDQMLGPYQVVEQVGQGGMATVYKAYHAKLDRHVAIKVMHETFTKNENFLARFEREARIVARLEHPNIVSVYDYSEDNGRPYLVMKFVEGSTLKRRLIKTGLTIGEVRQLMTPIADALSYAHEKGVLHRDIKPSNIMIDERGIPYLTDFGLARIAQVGESTISHDVMLGTPYYISPEQAQGEKRLGPETDIYSLGIILYELLVGHVPFGGDTPYAIVHEHIYTQPEIPSQLNFDLSDQVDRVILKALAKNPTERYPSASTLMQAFSEALDGTGEIQIKSSPASPTSPPKSSPPRAPQPPKPPGGKPVVIQHKGKRVKVEGSLDMGNIDFRDLGKKMETGIKKGAAYLSEIAEQIEFESGKPQRKLTEEEKIRRRIEKRLKERQEFMTHVAIYLAVNAFLWMIWLVTGAGFPWPIFVTLGWGIGMVAHSMDYYHKHGRGARNREDEIEREVERELYRSQMYQKSKTKNEDFEVIDMDDVLDMQAGVRLTEDGELTDSFIEEADQFEQRGRL